MIAKAVPTIDDYLKNNAHLLRYKGARRLIGKRQDDPQFPLVTVITIVRNGKKTLSQAIMSVLNQSYPNIEYIVVDGASTDGTLEVIKRFDDKIDLWISEPDSGTSDAFNKAISMAEGDFIFWLSADDWIVSDFIKAAVQSLLVSGADFVFGDMVMYEQENQAVVYKAEKNYTKSLMSGYPRFHFPTLVIKKECFQRVGLIDLTYKYVADYEWLVRLHLSGGRGLYVNSLIVHRRVGGLGEKYLFRSALEHLRLLRKYRLPKSKAMGIYLYYFMCKRLGGFSKVLLPTLFYKKLKRIRSGGLTYDKK